MEARREYLPSVWRPHCVRLSFIALPLCWAVFFAVLTLPRRLLAGRGADCAGRVGGTVRQLLCLPGFRGVGPVGPVSLDLLRAGCNA